MLQWKVKKKMKEKKELELWLHGKKKNNKKPNKTKPNKNNFIVIFTQDDIFFPNQNHILLSLTLGKLKQSYFH
jgi:hypothetical protein